MKSALDIANSIVPLGEHLNYGACGIRGENDNCEGCRRMREIADALEAYAAEAVKEAQETVGSGRQMPQVKKGAEERAAKTENDLSCGLDDLAQLRNIIIKNRV